VDPELDLQRLARLRDALGGESSQIARTLRDEMSGALDAIDAGLRDGDMNAVALASHAARNSALLIDARPVLAHLNELERCARCDEHQATLAARERLTPSWSLLLRRLSQIATKSIR
jgi:hypothetical protein